MCLENETGSTHADSPELLFHRPGLFLYGTLWRRRGRTAHGVSEIKQEAQQRIQTKLGLKFGSSGTMRVLTHGRCSAFFCTCSSSESLRVTKCTGSVRDENSNNKLSSASSSAHRQEVVKARKSPAPLMWIKARQLLPVSVFSVSSAAVGFSCRLLFTCRHKTQDQDNLVHVIQVDVA